ncbi:MAG: hypothetical protein J0H57_16270 [Rhodospirillales bacterium]|nr:hypothetical protein [Rhodospirillales bacterium]
MVRTGALPIVVSSLLFCASASSALAESAPSKLQITVTPYVWLPTVNLDANYPISGGGSASTSLSTSPGNYLSHLNFAAMVAAEARYERFSVMTDFLYLNAQTEKTQTKSFDFGDVHIPVNRSVVTSSSTRLEAAVWTLTGGYTVAEGDWGNVDLLAGFRMLALSDTTNLGLSVSIIRPDRSVAFGQTGSLSFSKTFWNGIGGVRARFNLAHVDWLGGGEIYLPLYADAGGGGTSPTWQVFGGLGYQGGILSVSAGYRYLSFGASGSTLRKLNLGGPIIAVSVRF